MYNLLFYDRSNIFGGHEVMSFYLIESLIADGYKISVLLSEDNQTFIEKLLELKEIKVIKIHGHSTLLQPIINFTDSRTNKRLHSVMDEISPSLVIALQGNIEISSEIIRICRKRNIPIISYIPIAQKLRDCSRHKKIGIIRDWLDSYYFKRISHFITISNFQKQLISERDIPNNRISVLENGIDFDRLKKCNSNEIKIKYDIHHKYIYGIVGRIEFIHKGQDVVAKMLAKYRQEFKDCGFVFAGSGKDLDALKHMVKEFELDDMVYLLGNVTDVNEVYSMIDTLLIPSHYEGVPLVAYEALYMGCNICGNDIMGVTDILEDGYIFHDESIETIKNVLLYVKNNPNNHSYDKGYLDDNWSISSFKKRASLEMKKILKTYCGQRKSI